MGLVDAASEASGPLLAGLDLAGRGREARTISIILGFFFNIFIFILLLFFYRKVLGSSWGFMAPGATL